MPASIPLPCRPPYDWPAIRDFLAGRAIPGVEVVAADRYARTIAFGGWPGSVAVTPAPGGLLAVVAGVAAADIPGVATRLRHLFACDADPAAIGAHLSADPHLAPLVAARPGLRVPGAWSGFELGVRAILGQQVSVAAATRLAGRLVAELGTPLAAAAGPGLTRLFPNPERVAAADVAEVLGMPRARGAAIRALAAAALAEPDLFAQGQDLATALGRLTAIRGIGPWTAQYIAMRALGAPDALPVGDVGLMRALDAGAGRPSPAGLLQRAEAWRPYRAYAAMHLWAADADGSVRGKKANATDSGARDGMPGTPKGSMPTGTRGPVPVPNTGEAAMPTIETTHPEASDALRRAALSARDAAFDGRFVYSVRSTGVYCRPSCPSRAARPENVAFHATCAEAEAAGFRPCKRCRPDEAAPEARRAEAVARACRLIDAAETLPTLDALAREAGMSPFHFHRVFKAVAGVTPKAYGDARRASRMAETLPAAGSVTQALYAAGYGAASRFYAGAGARLGMAPATYRKGGTGETIRFAVGPCSLGAVLVAATERGVCAILLGDDADALLRDLEDRFPNAALTGGDPAFEAVVAQVVGLVEAPGRAVALPLDIGGTAFQQKVWAALREIPAGTTASYTEIARRIGTPAAVRAVAGACGANALAVAIPCHRVVRADGSLSGYRWGIDRKRDLLAREGVER